MLQSVVEEGIAPFRRTSSNLNSSRNASSHRPSAKVYVIEENGSNDVTSFSFSSPPLVVCGEIEEKNVITSCTSPSFTEHARSTGTSDRVYQIICE